MRFIIVLSLVLGIALGSPIGQVADEQVTTLVPDLLRSDILADATTVVVEILSDDVPAVTSATQRARQAAAGGEDEDGSEEEEEGTTPASAGSGSSSAGRIRPPPAIPQPLANSSDFLAEYQFSTQFNLGPKDSSVPLSAAAPASVPAAAASGSQPVAQVAEAPVVPSSPPVSVAPTAAPSSNASSSVTPLSNNNAPQPTVANVEDEDVDSDEEVTEAAPAAGSSGNSARQQQQEAQRVEESDSDNEIITSDDVTTVRSFASEYEYTVQQLGSEKRRGEIINPEIPTMFLSPRENRTEQEYGGLHSDNLDFEPGYLSDGDGRAACECGKLPFRVPNGGEAEINLRPWTVAIVRGGLIAGGRPHCAGVLINDRYVLTSASCMSDLHPNGIQVWLTAHSSLDNHHLNVGTSKLNVQEIIPHPNYRRGYKDNDIALVKMTQPVDITTSSSYFTPICLPSVSKFDYAGRYGQIFGWGHGRVNRICAAEVPILDNGVCRRDTRHGSSITENMMCAGFLTPAGPVRTTDCIGDAGSPLTVYINGRTSLIGITSWGFEFHNRGHTPTVYTRVSLYAEWVLHNTEDADWCSA